MSKRDKIIISITGIFLVLLILMGLTYAYFLTQIKGNTKDKSISITTANLKLIYDDGNETVTINDLVPNSTFPTKTFSVENSGDSNVDYNVYFENVINELNRTSDLVYTLTCKSYKTTDYMANGTSANETGNCNGMSETTFPTVNGSVLTNSINEGITHYYELTITYKETREDQSEDMDKSISAKINIYDDNNINNLTLGYHLLNDSRITKNNDAPTFSATTAVSTELGMYKTEDDYGDTWYFRGAQSYNYVNFAGFTWRIVRINGDGSIRLILDNVLHNVYREGETDYAGESVAFNNPYGDNAYIGYMYGTPNSDTYDKTHENINSSTIKQEVDKFYETYIENATKNYHYGAYLADSLFCGDKTIATNITEPEPEFEEDINTKLGYGKNKTYYAALARIYYDDNKNTLTNFNPTLKCASGATDAYSRYTVDVQTTTKGVETNGDLTYPIALLSADEAMFAGVTKTSATSHYLTYTADFATEEYNWYSMTPMSASIDYPKKDGQEYDSNNTGNYGYTSNVAYFAKNVKLSSNDGNVKKGVRPVINLKSNVEIANGDGTETYPYVLKEISGS